MGREIVVTERLLQIACIASEGGLRARFNRPAPAAPIRLLWFSDRAKERVRGQPATVHLARVGASGVTPLDLCKACAEQVQAATGTFCMCGKTLAEIERTGQPGCPECYRVFTVAFHDIIKGCQGG